MNLVKNNKGFTLIETLVAINLSFLAITFIFSFYLFTKKFTETLSKNYTEKYLIQSFFSSVDKALKKPDYFEVTMQNGNLQIISNQNASFNLFKDSISLNNILSLSSLDRAGVTIFLFDNRELIIEPGTEIENGEFMYEGTFPIKSYSIKSIRFEIEKRAKKYSYEFYLPDIAIKRFENIRSTSSPQFE